MPGQLKAVLRYFRYRAGAAEADRQSDGQLLQRFVAERDEGAFAALLQRHGPVVFAVCRRVLRDVQDAEDAFQATFLVLARKAASIRRGEALAAWLHRVALNVSRTLQAGTNQRRAYERQAALMAPAAVVPETELHDLQPVVHEEVDRLPRKYRVPIVLCYFQGMTHEAAARQLGWPVGTVKGRLARAREMLRSRLVRRGLAVTSIGLTATLGHSAVEAVPSALIDLTRRAAVAFAAGGTTAGGLASTHTLTLATGVLRAMITRSWLTGMRLLLAMSLVGVGAMLGTGAWRGRGPASPVATSPAPAQKGGAVELQAGPEVHGLRALVTPVSTKVEAGDAIPIRYVVRNVSKEEQTLWHSGFWPNHQILVKDARGKEAPLTELGKQCRSAFAPGGKRDKNVPMPVPAGKEDAAYEQYDLARLFDLSRPGRYTVQYVYEENQGHGWRGRLPSNEAAFEVVARRQKEAGKAGAVVVKGLRFEALAPRQVHWPAPPGTSDVDLGLRVTNVSDRPVNVATFDVIRPRLTTADGQEVRVSIGRDGLPRATPPAVLAPGASWTWRPQARLEWAADDISILLLRGPDGRGVPGFWWFTVKQGKYRLAVEYANNNARQDDIPLWVGKAATKEVELEIVARENREPGEKPAARPAEDAAKANLDKLQGTWRLVAVEEAGKAVPPPKGGRDTPHWVFAGDRATFTSGLRVLEGTITLDPAKNPRWIDMRLSKDMTLQGIYEIKGNRLRLFLHPTGAGRPTEFKARQGEQQSIGIYQHDKKDS